jgi:ribonuclease D
MPYLSQISNEEIASLETETFPGKIVVISSPGKVSHAVAHLRRYRILGFDTETRPNFRKGESHEVSLLQLSTPDTCYLFRLNVIGMPPAIEELLADEGILKVGLSIGDDFRALRCRTQTTFGNFVDLQHTVKQSGDIRETSLRKIYALLFHKNISKGQRLTNWDAAGLTPAQQRYAALDAWACLRIYEAMRSGSEKDFTDTSRGTDNVCAAREDVGNKPVAGMLLKEDTSMG